MNNARNFNGTNGNLNNNNVTNKNRVQAVTNLLILLYTMTEREIFFSRLIQNYYTTRTNKRYGHDALDYEVIWPVNVVREMQQRLEGDFYIDENSVFLTSRPRWREIVATCFKGRSCDHEVCDILSPYVEQRLCPRTYNNRIGKGAVAAISQHMEDVFEVTNGYTKPARIIKLDMKGYFPNGLWNYAEECLASVVKDNRESIAQRYGEWMPDYLLRMIMIGVHANPIAHCVYKTPLHFWTKHISPDKSLRTKPEGVGAAIGRLIWQMAMGLYINDDIEWLINMGICHVVCFVDDIIMVVPEHRHQYALSIIPLLRERFAKKNVMLNDRKFYDQPYQHGVEFLGSHLKPGRWHLNASTYDAAIRRIEEFNHIINKDLYIEQMVASVNSYTGLLKNRTDHHRLCQLISRIDDEWWEYLEYDTRRYCVRCRAGYTERDRLSKHYHLRLTKKPRKTHSKPQT